MRNLLETVRTFPVQATEMAIDLCLGIYSAAELFQSPKPPISLMELGAAALAAAAVLYQVAKASEQVELRDRVEAALEEHGFIERIMSPTTRQYCSRQAARVACEKFGFRSDYDTLCAQKKKESMLTWLP